MYEVILNPISVFYSQEVEDENPESEEVFQEQMTRLITKEYLELLGMLWGTLRAKTSLQDGWTTCNFTSFSTVFQSYQDIGRMIMKGCVQWNPVYG